ncbi:MAG: hypothetical protein KatS3mg090_0336 [Patescibacteria group bacterium]|nr:MAG: hypothetical protein KatS3mg090_0336 [Patescibacteria group bacterium]
MLNFRIKLALICLFIVGCILLVSEYTSADLVAERIVKSNSFKTTTLNFGSINTANFSPLSFLFTVSGLQPSGFEIRAVKIINQGQMRFNYRISSKITGGNNQLCDELSLRLYNQSFNEKYNGKLKDFYFDSELDKSESEFWIFYLSLPDNAGSSLKNKTCEFDIIFKSWRNYPTQEGGFSALRVLSNNISTGSW